MGLMDVGYIMNGYGSVRRGFKHMIGRVEDVLLNDPS